MSVPVLVYTCDAYRHLLPGFAYLFRVFWSEGQEVLVAGCKDDVSLPDNFRLLPVESRIKERWSDGLIEALNLIDSDIVCLMLEDYYLVRGVPHGTIESLVEYMLLHPNILKIDLTADRLYSGHAVDVDYWGSSDVIETDWNTPYQFSTQAGLWHRRLLLSTLRPEMSPQDFELRDDHYPELKVCGTRAWPLRYVNLVGMGLSRGEYRTEHIRHGLGGTTIERIPTEHLDRIRRLLPADMVENSGVNI